MTSIQAASFLRPEPYGVKQKAAAGSSSLENAGQAFSQFLEEGHEVNKSQEGMIKNEVTPESVIWDTTQWLNTFEIINSAIKAGSQAVKETMQTPL